MRQLVVLASTVSLFTALSGCGDDSPQCSGTATISTLRQMIDEQKHVKEALIGDGQKVQSADYDIVDIITTEQTPKKASCKAGVSMSVTLKSGETKTVRAPGTFTYTAELTDDGKLYVEASGL